MSTFDDPRIQKQFEEYKESYVEPETVSKEELVEMITKDLTFASSMPVEEYTLYLKWQECQRRFPVQEVATLFGEEKQMVDQEKQKLLDECKNNIWFPEDPMDFEKLEPEMIYTSKTDMTDHSAGTWQDIWNVFATMLSSMRNSSNIGRNLHYVIRDRVTKKYLGITCLTGDFIDLTPRDDYIGWEREYKTNSGKLNNSCIGSTIVPTQPLGFNYTGGKLISLLCLSDQVQNDWENNYGDKLVSVTTTSLYGKSKEHGISQYDNLKYWKKMGYSSGSLTFELTKATEKELLKYGEKHFNEKFFSLYVATRENGQPWKRDHRNRFRSFIFSKLGIPKDIQKTDHGRGIYYSILYDNTREFLRGEIEESQLIKRFDSSVDALSELWRERYARKRINSLLNNNRTNLEETLFYGDVCFMTWDETKEKYLGDVGR